MVITSVHLRYCMCDWLALDIVNTAHIHEEERCRKRMDKSHSTQQSTPNQSEPFYCDSLIYAK